MATGNTPQAAINDIKSSRDSIAQEIRNKGVAVDTTAKLADLPAKVAAIATANLQSNKTVTPSESKQTVTPDSGYNGLSQVTVNAVSSTYVGSGVAKKSSSDLTASGAKITAPAGYYANAASKSIPNATVSLSGTATAGKASGVITNMDNMNTISSATGTAGADYFRVAATATGTAGSCTPSMSVTSAGYVSSNSTGSAVSVSVTGDTTGQKLYIPKAQFEVSGKSVKVTSTGGGYIKDGTTVGTVSTGSISGGVDVMSQNLTASASSDKLTLTASSVAPSSDYIAVTAGGSVTLAPYADCSTAGYVSKGVVGAAEYDESLTNTTKYYKISKVSRADTSLTSAKSNNTLVFTAENNQAAGYGDGGKRTATKTVSLSASGATVTATDGTNSISQSVTTATRAGTSITTTADDTNDKLTLTASNNQGTGYVTGSNQTASKVITLTASGATVTATDNSSTPVKISKSVTTASRASTTLTSAKNNNTLVFTAGNNQGTGYVTGSNSTASKTVSLSTSGATVTASDGTNSISSTIGSGSATTPATTITANPSLSTTYTSGSGYKMSVSKTQSVTPTVSAGYVSSGTAGTITVSGSAYVAQSSTGSATSSTSDTATVTIGYGQQTTIGAGYHHSARIIRNSVASGKASTPATTITKNPSISVNSSGVISASVSGTQSVTPSVTAGYVSSGTAGTITVSGSATKKATDLDTNLKAEYIKENIKIFGVTGNYKGGASVGTCTVKLGIGSMDWYANNNVRVFYTSYSSGAFNTNVVQTNASTTSTITLSNVVCGSAISVWTQVYAYISPSTYTKYTDEYNHCFMCPNSPGQTITIDLLENS